MTTATTILNQQGGGGSGGGTGGTSSGTATTGGGTPHGTTTSTPHGTTTTQAATTTTRLNTIKPLPGRSAPPYYDYNSSTINSASPLIVNGQPYGVCRGTPPTTEVIISWTTFYTDYVQLGQDRGTNYPANDSDVFRRIPCDANHGPLADPRARVTFTLFGPGGETTADASIFVSHVYQP